MFFSHRTILSLWALLVASAVATLTTQAGKKDKGGPPSEPPPAPPVRYETRVVPPLQPGAYSEVFDVNASGLAVGSSNISVDGIIQVRAILFDSNTNLTVDVNDLIDSSAWLADEMFTINDNNWMAGYGYRVDSAGNRASLKTAILITPDLDGDGTYEVQELIVTNSDPTISLNNDGDVLGSSSTPSGFEAYLWTIEHGAVFLGNPFGHDLTDRVGGLIQLVGGDANTAGGSNTALTAFFDVPSGSVSAWQDLGFAYEDSRTTGFGSAAAINNSGVIAGSTTFAREDWFAAIYTAESGWQSLGTLSSSRQYNNSAGIDMNESQWVVGDSTMAVAQDISRVPFLHVDSIGMFNVYDLMTVDGLGLLNGERLRPTSISNGNFISGWFQPATSDFFQRRGVVLVPVPVQTE